MAGLDGWRMNGEADCPTDLEMAAPKGQGRKEPPSLVPLNLNPLFPHGCVQGPLLLQGVSTLRRGVWLSPNYSACVFHTPHPPPAPLALEGEKGAPVSLPSGVPSPPGMCPPPGMGGRLRHVEAGGEDRGWEGFSGFLITKRMSVLVRRVCGWFETLHPGSYFYH